MIGPFRRPTRNSEALQLLEAFLISGVISFLGIRALLGMTGYPQVGGGGLHIAHMLWGGLLMLTALLLLLIYLDRPLQRVAAIIAGLGFGTFIDEIGKFVTSDNNYLFQPAVALIYVSFVAVYLVGRSLVGGTRLAPREALANALDVFESYLGKPIDPDDRARIGALLAEADQTDPLVADLRRALMALPGTADVETPLDRIHRRLADAYAGLVANAWFERALAIAVVLYAGVVVIGVLGLIISASASTGESAGVARLGQSISALVGAGFVLVGAVVLPTSRRRAYHWFVRGLLVWILVTQVFLFYTSQLAALVGLFVGLAAYGTLRFALVRESTMDAANERAQAAAVDRTT